MYQDDEDPLPKWHHKVLFVITMAAIFPVAGIYAVGYRLVDLLKKRKQ